MLPLALTAPSTSHGQAKSEAGKGVCSPLWMVFSMNVVVNARFCLPYITSVCVCTVVCILVHLCMCAHFILVCACDACVYVCGHVCVCICNECLGFTEADAAYSAVMLRDSLTDMGSPCLPSLPISCPQSSFQPPSNQWLTLPRTAGKMDSSTCLVVSTS